jgi:hypothetical protein
MPKPAIKTYALTLSEPPNMRNKIFKIAHFRTNKYKLATKKP